MLTFTSPSSVSRRCNSVTALVGTIRSDSWLRGNSSSISAMASRRPSVATSVSLFYAEHLGLKRIVEELERLARIEKKFTPSEILKKHARDGTKFYEE